jgi:DNA-binding transcriptional LysR family regulator
VVARLGSFSGAARELSVAPSVVTKRITQLEERMGTPLFVRSTRGLGLTSAGERYMPRFLSLVAELEEILNRSTADANAVEGHLRLKAPTTVTSLYLGSLFSEFQSEHPAVTLEIVLLDRSVNPLEERFDLVIGARPASYPDVIDIPLCSYDVALCAAPAYLASHSGPQHPTEIVNHDCLTSVLLGTTWLFEAEGGALGVEVHSRFHANDGRVLLEATRRGLGLATLPRFLAGKDLASGRLIEVLPEFPIPSFSLKALVPRVKMRRPAVRELVNFLKARMQSLPPCDGSN